MQQHQQFDNFALLQTFCLSPFIQKLSLEFLRLDEKKSHPLLISGEKGTGKELLAKNIHYHCSSLSSPFLTFSCAKLPYEYFEKKLEHCFSTIKNWSLSAQTVHKLHNGTREGTIFFREIGNLKSQAQQKVFYLLKTLIEKSVSQLNKKESFNIRLIFSFTYNRKDAPDTIHCSESLYKVFNPKTLVLKPLRERKEDIEPLSSFFIDMFSKEYGKDIGGIHSGALQFLQSYSWPGNVSELKNVMENAVLLSQNPLIIKDDIRFNVSKKFIALESFFNREDFFTLSEIEKIYIQTILKRTKNNKSKASKILGISRNTLQNKLKAISFHTQKRKNRKISAQRSLPF